LCSAVDGEIATPVPGYPLTAFALVAGDMGFIPEIWPNLGITCPPDTEINHAALLDSDGEGGQLLAWWPLLRPYTITPWPFPTSAPRLDVPPAVTHALNGTGNLIIGEAGDQIGMVDGKPLTAACRLVAHGGSICAGGLTVIEEADVAAAKREVRRAEKDAARAAFLARPRLITSKRRDFNL
jgi:hypothetical protein